MKLIIIVAVSKNTPAEAPGNRLGAKVTAVL